MNYWLLRSRVNAAATRIRDTRLNRLRVSEYDAWFTAYCRLSDTAHMCALFAFYEQADLCAVHDDGDLGRGLDAAMSRCESRIRTAAQRLYATRDVAQRLYATRDVAAWSVAYRRLEKIFSFYYAVRATNHDICRARQ